MDLAARRPLVYLDQSALSDAFLAVHREAGADLGARKDLAALVGRMASRGTLCLSLTHIIELVAWSDRDLAIAMGNWLERLEHSWMQVQDAEEDELIGSVRWKLGIADTPPSLPLHRTLTGAARNNFRELTPGGTLDILSDPTIGGMVRKSHGKVDGRAPKAWSTRLFARLHADRTSIPPGTTADEVHARGLEKLGRGLKLEARAAMQNEPVILGTPPLLDEVVDAAVDQLLADPLALPMSRIVHHAFTNVGDRIADQTVTSKNFTERYGSFLFDLRHLVAAAFCDVFTCDYFVDQMLTDFRVRRGLPKQLSIVGCGGIEAFVATLGSQFDAAST